jgi:hypothetical protein
MGGGAGLSTTPGAVDPARSHAEDTLRLRRRHGARRWPPRGRAVLQRRDALRLLTPGAIYLGIRLLGLLLLGALCVVHDKSLAAALGAWDGQWYLQIAAHGYDGVDPSLVDGYGHRDRDTPLAFFPGYPALIRLVTLVPGIGILSAAIVVSLVMGVLAAYGLIRLARGIDQTSRLGLLLVVLFAAEPMAVVLSMAYTEALFCALAVWALVGVLERKWLLAGFCCAAAGLVRLTAAALVAVVVAAAVVAVVGRRDSWRPWSAVLLAPAGLLLYLGWVGTRTGRPDGYFVLQQRGWSSAFDGGLSTLNFGIDTLSTDASVLETFTVWIVLVALVLLVLCVRNGLAWPLIAFALLVLVQDLGSNGLMYSKVRLLLPAFPLLLPLVTGIAKQRTLARTCTVVLIICFGAWFGAYSLTAWRYAI